MFNINCNMVVQMYPNGQDDQEQPQSAPVVNELATNEAIKAVEEIKYR